MRAPCLPQTLLSLLLLAGALPAAARIEVRAALSPQRIGLGETATFVVQVNSDNLSSIRFNPAFVLDNFELAGETERMNDMRYGSNGLTRVFRTVWHLRPLRTGKAAVRQIAIEVNGTVLPLTDREVAVQRLPARNLDTTQEPDDPF
jgi:hypothetical protein